MSYLLSIALVISGFIKKNSKIISMLLIILMWILYGWNTGNVDYLNYNMSYSLAAVELNYKKEIGFQLMNRFFNLIGLDFNQSLIIISIIGLLLIFSTIKLFTNNIAFVLALYFIFPFILDVVQVRNFMALSIFIYAIRFLINPNKRFRKSKYTLCILLASTIHYASLFYLLFLLADIKNIKFLKIISSILVVLGFLLIYTGSLEYLIIKYLDIKLGYFETRVDYGFYVNLIFHITTLFMVRFAYFIIKNDEIKYSNNHNEDDFNINIQFSRFVYKINIISLILFVLYFYSLSFLRIYRNVFLINYILFSILLSKIRKKENRLLYGLILFIYITFISILFLVKPYYDTVLLEVLTNNSLIGN